ncbi:methyltransferase family protein [Klebsiella huaxiensis]|uniref:methyltransferase family protein n=1 Tax=Klebsiella huaxiensis TaxID=2153354 RepID=UPI002B3FFFE0|nr:methyltransferase [Klebsiella huaxiensis]
MVLNKTTINVLQVNKAHVLITNGCYRFSRNPVYLGFAGIQFSSTLLLNCVPGIFATLLLMFLMTHLHIRYEEVAIQRIFGPEWVEYQKKHVAGFDVIAI